MDWSMSIGCVSCNIHNATLTVDFAVECHDLTGFQDPVKIGVQFTSDAKSAVVLQGKLMVVEHT